MSWKITQWVCESSEAVGSARLVSLVLSENADEDTGECYPSMETICRKARVSERTARSAIRSLEALGEIETFRNKGLGTRPDHLTNVYVFTAYLVQSRGAKSAGRVPGWGADRQSEESRPANLVDPTGNALPTNHQENHQEPNPTKPAKRARRSDPRADTLTKVWWERFTPRPLQPFVAARGVVSSALSKGYSVAVLERALAMLDPPLSGGRLDAAVRRAGHRNEAPGSTWEDVAARDQERANGQ